MPDAAPADLRDLLPLFLARAPCRDSRIASGDLIGNPNERTCCHRPLRTRLIRKRWSKAAAQIAVVPFNFVHKFQATFRHYSDIAQMFVKVALNMLMARASAMALQRPALAASQGSGALAARPGCDLARCRFGLAVA